MRLAATGLVLTLVCQSLCPGLCLADEADAGRGVVRFEPTAREMEVGAPFRLQAHQFPFEQKPLETSSERILISEVTFPSPVKTAETLNNTVHCEYFRPAAKGKYPGVVMLHILGGDFDLARLFCRSLAYNGVGALFLKMPYYGPRRQPGSKRRMVSFDPHETVLGMTQAVLDIRRGAAWLGAREEIDNDRLGVCGISLGGITGALALTCEPRFHCGCLLLAGAGVGSVGWESKELAPARERWLQQGGDREGFIRILRTVDPAAYGKNAIGRRVLLINANFDRVVPKASTLELWRSFGEPPVVWLDCGHYSSARFIFESLRASPASLPRMTGLSNPSSEPPEGDR